MKSRSRGPARDVLGRPWGRWTAAVELFARRRPARRRVDPATYAALHRELVAACRSLAESAEGDGRRYYEDLGAIAGPWLTPNALAQADAEVLDDLLARCRRVGRELGVRDRAALRRGLRALAAAALAGLIALLPAAGLDPGPILDRLRGPADRIWLVAARASVNQKLAAAAFVVVFVSIRAVSRTRRA